MTTIANIVCAAVIGQENNPLFLDTYVASGDPEDALRFSYIVHCALDAVDEKVSAPKRTPGEIADAFLGLLYPTEDYAVYGFISNTKVKFILVVGNGPAVKEDELRMVFRRFHAAYVDAVSNPFYDVGSPVSSGQFAASVRAIMQGGVVAA